MGWLWLAGAALFGVAALSVWWAFTSPRFYAGLSSIAAKAAWKMIAPEILRRMTPQEEEDWHRAIRQGRSDEWLRERARKRR